MRSWLPLDTFDGSSLHCSPWESRPDVHESMHHALGVCVGPTPTAVLVGRSSAARFLVSGFTAATDTPFHSYGRSHDRAHPTPQRTHSARRRPPARRTLVRAGRRNGDRCAVVHRRRAQNALVANEPVERPKAAVGGRDVEQDERVRVPIARRRTRRCRFRVPRGRAIAHRPSLPDRSGSTRPTCAMSQVGRSRFTHRRSTMHDEQETAGARCAGEERAAD